MKGSEAAQAAVEEIKTSGAEFAQRAANFAGELQTSAMRNARRVRVAGEDALDQTRHEIKSRPISAVAVVSAAALTIGFTLGWLFGRRR